MFKGLCWRFLFLLFLVCFPSGFVGILLVCVLGFLLHSCTSCIQCFGSCSCSCFSHSAFLFVLWRLCWPVSLSVYSCILSFFPGFHSSCFPSSRCCQPCLPFQFPVHRLHWSRHSLSLPLPPPSVIRPPDQCRPRTPYPLRIVHPPPPPPPPSTIPPTPLYLTHKTPPTLTHWWVSTWGAQPRHPTYGSQPLTHQPITLHLPTP